jgi:hypothetical protein
VEEEDKETEKGKEAQYIMGEVGEVLIEATADVAVGVAGVLLSDTENIKGDIAEVVMDGAKDAAVGVAEVMMDQAVSPATTGGKSVWGKLDSGLKAKKEEEETKEENGKRNSEEEANATNEELTRNAGIVVTSSTEMTPQNTS